MFINSLPDPVDSFTAERPWLKSNLVVHARSTDKYYYPDHSTPYMLIANLNSRGNFMVNQQKLSLSGQSFLFLSADDKLSIRYDKEPVESLFILFKDEFIHRSYSAFTTDYKELLEHPFDQVTKKNNMRSIPLQMDPEILSFFNCITSMNGKIDEFDEELVFLIGKIIHMEGNRINDIEKIRAAKKTTKVELYRRLFAAREYMEGNCTKPGLNLDEIASYANLDKFHFILNFRHLFGTTPHQYLITIKLKKACELILSQNYSITEVCYLTGFESLPSFSNLFKKKFGVFPSLFSRAASSRLTAPSDK